MVANRKCVILLAFLFWISGAQAQSNLARGKPCRQSSLYRNNQLYRAELAVNGIKESTTDFTHTDDGVNNWWTVDLGSEYRVSRIQLYNRAGDNCKFCYKLQKIYILTSANATPGDPDINKPSKWRIRSYRDKPYDSEYSIILEPDILVRHVAVYSLHTAALSLAEVEVYEQDYNLAYKKTTKESSNAEGSHTFPVDGRIAAVSNSDPHVSHTQDRQNQFWRVDLGEVYHIKWIELYNRLNNRDRLSDVTIWGSDKDTPFTPPSTPDWEVIHRQEYAYGALGLIILNTVKRYRHIAVSRNGFVSLKEVQVFTKRRINYAGTGTAYQKSNYRTNSNHASNTIDGRLDTISLTEESAADEWWKVDLRQKIIFQYARIYARTDNCGGNPCANRLQKMHYLINTNPHDDFRPPNTDSRYNWKKCIDIDQPQGVEFTVLCEKNISPYIQQFAILTDNNKGVALREVQVYGYEYAPTFTTQKGATVDYKNYTELRISFDPWDVDYVPWLFNSLPDVDYSNIRYKITLNGETTSEVAAVADGKASFTWDGLNIATTYRFLISYKADRGDVCPGPYISIIATTKPCTEPDSPPDNIHLTHKVVTRNQKKMIQYTATWQQPSSPNCLRITDYKWIVDSGPINTVTETSAIFEVEAGGVDITFSVWSVNNVNQQSASPARKTFISAYAQSDAPESITVAKQSSNSVMLSWQPPTKSYGVISKYQYKCTGASSWTETPPNTRQVPDINNGYHPYQPVECEVRAINRAAKPGDSGRGSGYTACAAPEFLQTIEYEDDYVKVTDGKSYRKITVDSSQSIKSNCGPHGTTELKYRMVDTTQTPFTSNNVFTDLSALTLYKFEVQATNEAGIDSQRSLDVTTKELEPTSAPGLSLDSLAEGCINITLKRPVQANGVIIQYQIECDYVGEQTEIPTKNFLSADKIEETTSICDLNSASLIQCKSRGATQVGSGPLSGMEQAITKPNVSGQSMLPDVPQVSDSGVTITLKKISLGNKNIQPSSYLVVVEKRGRLRRAISIGRCLAAAAVQSQTISRMNFTLSGSCYIAAEILSNDPKLSASGGYKFKLGDGIKYNSYTNHELSPSEHYTVWRAITYEPQGSTEQYVTVLGSGQELRAPGPTQPPVTESATKSGNAARTGGIAGGVVAVAVAVAVVMGVILRRRMMRRKKNQGGQVDLTDLHQHPIEPLPSRDSTKSSKKSSNTPMLPKPSVSNSNSVSTPVSPPPVDDEMYANTSGVVIPIKTLEDYITNNRRVIAEHYEKLKSIPDPDMSIALLPAHKGKNRYKGLYTGNQDRVVLKKVSGSDYINATYMEGYYRDRHYIAAQGATEATVDDFWIMIWQERPSVIIMVTQTIENGKMKCFQYWPEIQDDKLSFGDITVTLVSTDVWADYSIRTLKVEKGDEVRTLRQFNYVTWPDHGVPDDMGPFIIFYQKIKSATARIADRPLLVHCSAGVGRTGTYIAMDYLLQQAKSESVINPYSFVKSMRLRRPLMVQTVDQYQFLHQAVFEQRATSGYVSNPDAIGKKIEAFTQNAGSSADIISAEFWHIEKKLKLVEFDFSAGKDAANREKNRFSEILPEKKYSPFIQGSTGSYINAVFVNTYREKNQWLATQLPLSNTVADFWQLVEDQSIRVVVQLEAAQTQFYPRADNDQITAGSFTVQRTKAENTEYITNISLQITSKKRSTEVTVVSVNGWEQDLPSPDTIIKLQEALQKSQQQTGNNAICITCNNGSTRCGLFICCDNAIEKLKAEQEADVFNAVLMAKHRRPQFIPSKEYYLFVYQVLQTYADAFSEYANFK